MTSERIRVRAARAQDYPSLIPLWRQLDRAHADLQPEFFRMSERSRGRHLLSDVLDDPHARLLVAVGEGSNGAGVHGAGERIVGAIQVQIYDTPSDPAMTSCRRAYVEYLVIDAAYRRRGIGTRLMRAAEDWSAGCGAVQMLLTLWEGNAAAAFYAALRYRSVSRTLVRSLAVRPLAAEGSGEEAP